MPGTLLLLKHTAQAQNNFVGTWVTDTKVMLYVKLIFFIHIKHREAIMWPIRSCWKN